MPQRPPFCAIELSSSCRPAWRHGPGAACLRLDYPQPSFPCPPLRSKYQGAIDWPLVAASGVRFVSIRASEGTDYKDPLFASNWAGAHAAGLVRAAYHFARPASPAAAQADALVDAAAAAGGYAPNSSTLQFMLDLEDTDGLAPAGVWAWVQAFMARLRARTGRPGIIYVGYYFWRDNVGNPSDNLDAPLWIASYTDRPSVPSAWPFWTFWRAFWGG